MKSLLESEEYRLLKLTIAKEARINLFIDILLVLKNSKSLEEARTKIVDLYDREMGVKRHEKINRRPDGGAEGIPDNSEVEDRSGEDLFI